jgi:hypothetical protein
LAILGGQRYIFAYNKGRVVNAFHLIIIKMNHKIISLISYPKSGSVFLCHCLQHVLQTANTNETPTIKALAASTPHLNLKNEIYIHKHHKPQPTWDNQGSFLILVLRNPKEAIPSFRRGYSYNKSLLFETKRYSKLIKYWNARSNNKTIVYYEDIIDNTEKTIRQIVESAAPPYLRNIKSFNIDLSGLREASLKLKKTLGHKSLSGGDKPLFHSKNLTPQRRKRIGLLLQEQLPPSEFAHLHRYFDDDKV